MKKISSHTYPDSSALTEDQYNYFKQAKKKFLFVGILLFIFTGVTVAVATVPWLDFGARGFDHVDATIGLLIASIKASLVALIFMHLNHEKKMIYWIFGLGLFHGCGIFFGTYLHFADMPHYKPFYQSETVVDRPDGMTDLQETKPGGN
ncbi:cytochrome C oxidase subunit IV family protein [Luteolibacter sp. AS25]|uniref:cytochrome C oxidase subunit IV family protein n=1 Tax=Luteolibacter sp. AS25 TaxID=3135776 RepID=UPI00398B7E34